MKIGVLTTSFPRYEGDIAGCFVLGACRSLAERGHTLEVLAPEPRLRDLPPRWPGVEVRWLPYLRPRTLARTFYGAGVPENLRERPWASVGLATYTLRLGEELRRRVHGWDALMSHWALPSGLVASTLGRGKGHLAVCHSADIHALGLLPNRRAVARRIAAGASTMLFVSEALRARFLEFAPDAAEQCDLEVRPMGIDPPHPGLPERGALREELGLHHHTLLSLGRLVPIKGLDDLIDALAGAEDAELIIAGEGPERGRLEALAMRLGVRVRFVGVVRGRQKAAWLAAADALVLSSRPSASGRSEGMPTVLLEAMDAGLPIVATDQGGVASWVEHEQSGLLVPPGRPKALLRAIRRLRDDAPLRARLIARGRLLAEPQRWANMGPRLEEMLVRGEQSGSRPAARSGRSASDTAD